MRNIPGSVVDEAIDHSQVARELFDRTVYDDLKKTRDCGRQQDNWQNHERSSGVCHE